MDCCLEVRINGSRDSVSKSHVGLIKNLPMGHRRKQRCPGCEQGAYYDTGYPGQPPTRAHQWEVSRLHNLDWPRDFVDYGKHPPDPKWPGGARIAVNFNLNYEAGGAANILDGDQASEGTLNDVGSRPKEGIRSPLVESAFEYGSRVGVWRLLRIFEGFGVPISVFSMAKALERNPEATRAFIEGGHEIVSHGYHRIDYHFIDEDTQREHIRLAGWLYPLKRVGSLIRSKPSGNRR